MKNSLFAAVLCLFLVGACYAQGAATVMFASGNAQVVGRDGQVRAAVRGGELEAGETVETADGRVQLRFRDGANVSLQTATRFRIDEFRFVEQDGKASAGDRGFFSLLKGGFRTLSGLIGKERRDQYKVDAVVATIGIRGTDYSATLGDSGLKVSTFGGLVEVCSGAGCAQVAPGETVIVPDRNSLPRQESARTGGTGAAPLASDLAPPKPVELPTISVPAQTPSVPPSQGSSTAPPTQGPSYPALTGPSLR